MAQTIDQADPKFITSLKTNISGIYFQQVAQYTVPLIEKEFRKAVGDPALIDNEEFMRNLFFLVRKREVKNLHDDVWRLVSAKGLKPKAQVSALKTLFALGGENDRAAVDSMVADALAELIQSGRPPESSPYFDAADRVGGVKTLIALKRMFSDAAERQRVAEQKSPDNHAFISQLDKVRATLDKKVFTLSRKQQILAKPDADLTADLARLYLRRSVDLSCWAYRELTHSASPASRATVQTVVATELPSFLPASGIAPDAREKSESDLRLRGIALLQKMGAPLSDEENALLRENFELMRSREPFFYPACDWEDILDRL